MTDEWRLPAPAVRADAASPQKQQQIP